MAVAVAASRGLGMAVACRRALPCLPTVQVRHRTSEARARLLERNKRPRSYKREVAKSRKRVPVPYKTRHGHAIRTANHPEMVDRYFKFVHATAAKHGTAEAVAAFDAAAAAFPTPPPLVAASLVERGNLLMREPPAWESDFLQWSADRNDAKHGDLPDEFWENYGVVDDELKPSYQARAAKAGPKGASAAVGGTGEAAAGAGEFDMFEDPDAEDDDTMASTAADSFKAASRETEADKIRDLRSLDRALDSRLVLLVQEAGGSWTLPSGTRREGEAMVDAAARHATHALGAEVNLWYPGNAPMGVRLRVFDEATQEATGCYGAKVFFYRAEILNGRPALPAQDTGVTLDTKDAGLPDTLDGLLNGPALADTAWYTRQEMVAGGVLAPEEATYLQGIVGASPSEEGATKEEGEGGDE